MTRFVRYFSAILVVVLLTLLTSATRSEDDDQFTARPIGAQVIALGENELRPDRAAIRAFVPTGSLSNHCLATLSESNFPIPGTTVFCGPRVFQGQEGILFSVFFPQSIPTGLLPTGLFLSATVYQEGAHGYGTPVFYPGT
jgi:hypothetical protein